MPNRLITESSPYLLQHAGNPVDWFPWGAEAFAKASREDKPVFLSIGYSACHWCHVMERESFEDEEIAKLLNDHFVAVKVDREERPDVDAVYMDAVHALTGRGGWPLSVFLTPDRLPFYGGTYFPAEAHLGMPAFGEVLRKVASLWETRREELRETGSLLRDALVNEEAPSWASGASGELRRETLDAAVRQLSRSFDERHGGWGGAPKFPQPAVAEFMLRRYLATGEEELLGMVRRTLDGMMRGGICDQLGGGFHRYSVDEAWRVPHFEKMLYDNAQLSRLYLHAWQVTGEPEYRRVAVETLDYLVREMLDDGGGFYASQDADSEGEEGRYFVWTPEQIADALAGTDAEEDVELVTSAYGVTAEGNLQGASVLWMRETPAEAAATAGVSPDEAAIRLARARRALLAARERRAKPGRDEKVLAGWNGLALSAFAEAARVLGRDDYRAVADRNAGFVLEYLRDSGRICRSWSKGEAKPNGFLEDYAACAQGLLELYETTFESRWFAAALELAETALTHFSDPEGGFFDTADDAEQLFLRPKEVQDGAVPSGSAILCEVLVRLGEYTGEHRYARRVEAALRQVQPALGQAPLGMAGWLGVLDFLLSPPKTLAIVGEGLDPLLEVVRQRYRPNLVIAAAEHPVGDLTPELLLRQPKGEQPMAYLCHESTCERPVNSPVELAGMLAGE